MKLKINFAVIISIILAMTIVAGRVHFFSDIQRDQHLAGRVGGGTAALLTPTVGRI